MSKKLVRAGIAAFSLAMAPQAAHAVSISTTYEANGQLPGYTSAQIIQPFSYSVGNFNATPSTVSSGITQSESGSNAIRSVSSGSATRPDFATGNFLAIHTNEGNNLASYTLNFATPVQFLSFVFGTLDTYNSVKLTFSDSSFLTLTGAQIAKGASALINDFSGLTNGSLGSGNAEGRASYNMNGGPGLTSITFQSTNRAFEIDSIATAAPEPATWAMMLLGFGLVGSQLRRRRPALAKRLARA